MRKVRILPFRGKDKPPEPSEAPPYPQDLVSLLVVGDSGAGKTSLVQSFVSHESVVCDGSSIEQATAEEPDRDTPCDSSTSSDPQSSWSVAYFKKDFVFANLQGCLRSLRVQLWDTSGIVVDNMDDDATNADRSKNSNKIDRPDEWQRLVTKANKIVVVVSLAEDIETTMSRIQAWAKWLNSHQKEEQERQQKRKPVVLLLHQGDALLATKNNIIDGNHQHPAAWMDLGRRLSILCRQYYIQSWHITCSNLEDDLGNSVDSAFREILGHIPPTPSKRQPHGESFQHPTTASRLQPLSTPISSDSTTTAGPSAVAVTPDSKLMPSRRKQQQYQQPQPQQRSHLVIVSPLPP